jgi:CMP-N,N'-diacetyllegionaminic acid synthase
MYAIIPAREGSKSIPRKNIYPICGRPLISYSIESCKLCKNIDRIIVSTDGEEIAEISKKYGAEIPFMRPKEYATDESSDIDYLRHFFENIETNEVALLRPTTPLRDPMVMSGIIEIYYENKDEMSGLRTAQEVNQPAHKMFKKVGDYFEGFFSDFNGIKDYTNLPRQIFPKTYSPNGYIDIIKRETVEGGGVFGDKIFACVTKRISDVDSMDDIKFLELEVGQRHSEIFRRF